MEGEMLPPDPASPAPEATRARSRSKSKTPAATPTSTKNAKKRRWSATPGGDGDEGDGTPSAKKARTTSKSVTPTPRKRKAPAKEVLKSMPMGKTLDLCSEQDKMLIQWKEAGRTWDDIRKKWLEMTGDNTAVSTLPNRYSRLKSNFVVIKEEHNALLLEAKQEVEASFEREKWHLIGKAMEAKGADKYKPIELHRQYKNLMKLGMELKNDSDHAATGHEAGDAGNVEMQDN